jgi:hypothetical protein
MNAISKASLFKHLFIDLCRLKETVSSKHRQDEKHQDPRKTAFIDNFQDINKRS